MMKKKEKKKLRDTTRQQDHPHIHHTFTGVTKKAFGF
tara:strand:- start:325 stop:435 length:111 start_codon:yes stop_codon:yes gene_type:complete